MHSILNAQPRRINGLIFIICTLLLAVAYIMEHGFGMEPCNLCLFQRFAFVLIAAIAFLAWLHDPVKVGRMIYGILLLAAIGLGILIAGRHLYLQSLPADQVPDCGPPLDYMVQVMPFTQAITEVFNGSGKCADVSWRFLGLTIPGWSMAMYITLGLMAVLGNFGVSKSK